MGWLLTSLTKAERPPDDRQQLGLEQPFAGVAGVQGVHDDPGGAAFGERMLLVVDEPPLRAERRTARPAARATTIQTMVVPIGITVSVTIM